MTILAEATSSNDLISSLFVFALAGFIGLEVIKRVSPLLHTPLMSLTNALDAIAVLGAIALVGAKHEHHEMLVKVFGSIAIAAATSNIVGGLLITDRMLKMFKIDRRANKPTGSEQSQSASASTPAKNG